MSTIVTSTIGDDTEKHIRPGGCSKNNDQVDNIDHSTKRQNINGHATSLLTPRNVSEDSIKDLFTVMFHHKVRKCEQDG